MRDELCDVGDAGLRDELELFDAGGGCAPTVRGEVGGGCDGDAAFLDELCDGDAGLRDELCDPGGGGGGAVMGLLRGAPIGEDGAPDDGLPYGDGPPCGGAPDDDPCDDDPYGSSLDGPPYGVAPDAGEPCPPFCGAGVCVGGALQSSSCSGGGGAFSGCAPGAPNGLPVRRSI